MRQWWELKRKHFDCILFFKVGKFYEMYHMDAVISVNELNLTYMKVICILVYAFKNICKFWNKRI